MDVARTIECLRTLFLLLHDEQSRDWSDRRRGWRERQGKISTTAQKVQKELSNKLHPASGEELERWLRLGADDRLHVNFSEKHKVLYLPALEKDGKFVPILSVRVDVDGSRTDVGLRVMLITHDEAGALRGIGFRLEAPHRGDAGEGRHDFYHAQFLRDFDWGPRIESPEWLPLSQPSFPLLANSPVTLVLSLLLTLYGKREYRSFCQRHTAHLRVMKEEVNTIDSWLTRHELD